MKKRIKLAPDRTVVTVDPVEPGTDLLSAEGYVIKVDYLIIGEYELWHECDANAAVLRGRLVAMKYIEANTPVVVNLNLLRYSLEEPFDCSCGFNRCTERVSGFGSIPDSEKVRLLHIADSEVRREAFDWGFVPPATGPVTLTDETDWSTRGLVGVASRNISKGTTIFHVHGIVLPFPTTDTIQVAFGKHLLFNGSAQFVQHHCDPNVSVVVHEDGEGFDFVALRDITKGESIGHNYLSTEWDLAENFECRCGAPHCFRKIRGYVHLSERKQHRMYHMVSPVIRDMMVLVVSG
jgi:hypothetical protein